MEREVVPVDGASFRRRIANAVQRETCRGFGKPVSQIRVPGRSTGMSTSGDAVGTIREDGLADAPFDFENLFRTQYGRVTSVISRVVQNPARAEELAVDAFLKLWRTPGAHGPGATAWVLRTALRLGIDELRGATRRARYAPLVRLVGHVPSPEDSAASGEERRRVLRVLAAIRREYAALLLLHSHGCSYNELAATLELRPGSVGTLLRRARHAFRKEYIRRHGHT